MDVSPEATSRAGGRAPAGSTDERLRLLAVHAHPDDEASKGAGTVARYASEGVRCVLVTCTGGEAGDVLNPEADTPEVRADLRAARLAELEESVRVLGYERLHLLGYHDSGMPDTEHNRRFDNFANADFDEAVGRLVEIVREERPHVVLTYGDDHSRYPHPDHIKVHEISVEAFDAAGDPERYPDLGEPWQPLKLYYLTVFTKERVRFLHRWLLDHGEESPFQRILDAYPDDWVEPTTTRIDVAEHLDARRRALLAHRTQIGPDSAWFKVPDEVVREHLPTEELVLARSLVDTAAPEDGDETDLFDGIREAVRRPSTSRPSRAGPRRGR